MWYLYPLLSAPAAQPHGVVVEWRCTDDEASTDSDWAVINSAAVTFTHHNISGQWCITGSYFSQFGEGYIFYRCLLWCRTMKVICYSWKHACQISLLVSVHCNNFCFTDSIEISTPRRNVRPISIDLVDLRSCRVCIPLCGFEDQLNISVKLYLRKKKTVYWRVIESS